MCRRSSAVMTRGHCRVRDRVADDRRWSYGTPVTLIDEDADARQAEYFRAELDGERRQLLDGILKRRSLIERRAKASGLRTQVHTAEVEVRHLTRLIARLDHRFPPRDSV